MPGIAEVAPELHEDILRYRAQLIEREEFDWDRFWKTHADKDLYSIPGTHLLVTGNTGSGKTQLLLYFVRKYWEKPGKLGLKFRYTIVWLDVGKSSEISNLGKIAPLKIFVPEGCDMEVTVNPEHAEEWKGHKIVHFRTTNFKRMWRSMDPKKINVISLLPYMIDDMSMYAEMIGKLFNSLIELAQRDLDFEKILPMEFFADEGQLIIPEKVNQIDDAHYRKGAVIQRNLDSLRSCMIGFKMAVQGIVDIRFGCRKQFSWHAIKRKTRFLAENPELEEKNYLWNHIGKNEFYLADPEDSFSNRPIKFKYMGEGKDAARVRYIGKLHGEKSKPEDEDDGKPLPDDFNNVQQQLIQQIIKEEENDRPDL